VLVKVGLGDVFSKGNTILGVDVVAVVLVGLGGVLNGNTTLWLVVVFVESGAGVADGVVVGVVVVVGGDVGGGVVVVVGVAVCVGEDVGVGVGARVDVNIDVCRGVVVGLSVVGIGDVLSRNS